MKFSILSVLLWVLLLGAFKDVQGTVRQDEQQPENPLMEVRHQYHNLDFLELNKTYRSLLFCLF